MAWKEESLAGKKGLGKSSREMRGIKHEVSVMYPSIKPPKFKREKEKNKP